MAFEKFLELYKQAITNNLNYHWLSDTEKNSPLYRASLKAIIENIESINCFFRDPKIRDKILDNTELYEDILFLINSLPTRCDFSPTLIYVILQNKKELKINQNVLKGLIKNAWFHKDELTLLLKQFKFFYSRSIDFDQRFIQPLVVDAFVSSCRNYALQHTDLADILLKFELPDDLISGLFYDISLLERLFSSKTPQRQWEIFRVLLSKATNPLAKANLVVACSQQALKPEHLLSLKEELREAKYYLAYWKLSKQDEETAAYVIRNLIAQNRFEEVKKVKSLSPIEMITIKSLQKPFTEKEENELVDYFYNECSIEYLQTLSPEDAKTLASILYNIPILPDMNWSRAYCYKYFLVCKRAGVDVGMHFAKMVQEGAKTVKQTDMFYLQEMLDNAANKEALMKVWRELTIRMAIENHQFCDEDECRRLVRQLLEEPENWKELVEYSEKAGWSEAELRVRVGKLYFEGQLDDEEKPNDKIRHAIKAFEYLKDDKDFLKTLIVTLNNSPWWEEAPGSKLDISLETFRRFAHYYRYRNDGMIISLLACDGFIRHSDLSSLSITEKKDLLDLISAAPGTAEDKEKVMQKARQALMTKEELISSNINQTFFVNNNAKLEGDPPESSSVYQDGPGR